MTKTAKTRHASQQRPTTSKRTPLNKIKKGAVSKNNNKDKKKKDNKEKDKKKKDNKATNMNKTILQTHESACQETAKRVGENIRQDHQLDRVPKLLGLPEGYGLLEGKVAIDGATSHVAREVTNHIANLDPAQQCVLKPEAITIRTKIQYCRDFGVPFSHMTEDPETEEEKCVFHTYPEEACYVFMAGVAYQCVSQYVQAGPILLEKAKAFANRKAAGPGNKMFFEFIGCHFGSRNPITRAAEEYTNAIKQNDEAENEEAYFNFSTDQFINLDKCPVSA